MLNWSFCHFPILGREAGCSSAGLGREAGCGDAGPPPSCCAMAHRADQLSAAQLWQAGYHDHICVSRAFIEAVQRYMAGNPLKWEMQHNQPAFLRVREPLFSPRLDPGSYWRGVGNVSLLDAGRPVSISTPRLPQLRRRAKGMPLTGGPVSSRGYDPRDEAIARQDAAHSGREEFGRRGDYLLSPICTFWCQAPSPSTCS